MHERVDVGNHDWFKYERVIVFDGVCNWCNFWVNFTIARDPSAKFKFGLLQSAQARQIMDVLGLAVDDFQTFLLLERGEIFQKSTAALRVVKQLSGLWPLFYYCCIVVPSPLRDAVYDFIARRRYRWMGKSSTCRVPTREEQGRFV